jgi:hypothetical protein
LGAARIRGRSAEYGPGIFCAAAKLAVSDGRH